MYSLINGSLLFVLQPLPTSSHHTHVDQHPFPPIRISCLLFGGLLGTGGGIYYGHG